MRLGERELKMMSRLARAQARRMEHEHAASGAEPVQSELAPMTESLAAVM